MAKKIAKITTTLGALHTANVSGVLMRLNSAPVTGIIGHLIYRVVQAARPELDSVDAARTKALDSLDIGKDESGNLMPTPEQETAFQEMITPVLEEAVVLNAKPLNAVALGKALEKAACPFSGREWALIDFMLAED